MKGLITATQKRHYKPSEADNTSDNPGTISPKPSPRRTPKKRKSRASFKVPTCKRILDLPALPIVQIPESKNKDHESHSLEVSKSGRESCSSGESTDNAKHDLTDILSVIKPEASFHDKSKTKYAKEALQIQLLKVEETEDEKCCYEDKLPKVISSDKTIVLLDAPSDNVKSDEDNSDKANCDKVGPNEENSDVVTSKEINTDRVTSDKSDFPDNNKKSDDVDEGYFDSSYVDLEKILESSFVDASTETVTLKKTDATTVTETVNVKKIDATTATTNISLEKSDAANVTDTDDSIDSLNREFLSKLSLTTAVQTEESGAKRRKVNKACQITDEAVSTLNKKLLTLRNKLNKVIVEKDSAFKKNKDLEKNCSDLKTERLSLLAQTEALQTECVKKMYDNDKLTEKVEQKECHVATLKESLLLRDKELHLLHRQPNSAGVNKQINEYRELEMLRVDNIRLLHDNRALTASLDSLNGQLCALRRISRNYDECKDSVILMNKRLAQDNSLISANLSSLRRELKSVTQEHQETLEEMRYLRLSVKRSADQLKKGDTRGDASSDSCGDTADDNRQLRKQNSELKHSVEMLRNEVDKLHIELTNTRSAHIAFDKVLQDKCELQTQLQDVEANNAALWARVEELRERCAEQTDINTHQAHEHNILSGENSELRRTNDLLNERVESLQKSLDGEIQKNADMAKQIEDLNSSLSSANVSIQDLHSTMEFLQVEHSFIEADVEKKNDSIKELNAKIEEMSKAKQDMISKCKSKLKEKTKKLNASRIRLGYALLEIKELNSHGSSCSE